MKPFKSFRNRIVVCFAIFAYLCFVALRYQKVSGPNVLALLVGAGILLAIFCYPSKADPKNDVEPPSAEESDVDPPKDS